MRATKFDKFLQILPNGSENPLPMQDAARLLDLDVRGVRQLADKARRKGVPVCSSCDAENGGFYLPETIADAEPYVRAQRARIKSANIALAAVEKYVEAEGGART